MAEALAEKPGESAGRARADEVRLTSLSRGDVPSVIAALVVEHDGKLNEHVGEVLSLHGVELHPAESVVNAFMLLESSRFDVVLLDLARPGTDALVLLQRLRALPDAPVVIVTGSGTEEDKIVALESGADDCLSKPFDPRELVARMRAILRRKLSSAPTGPFSFSARGLVINFDARQVTVDGIRRHLTNSEYSLLCALAHNAGRVLSRDELLDLMKGDNSDDTFDRAVDVHISRLRTKIERDPGRPRYVKTIRGAGYVITRDD